MPTRFYNADLTTGLDNGSNWENACKTVTSLNSILVSGDIVKAKESTEISARFDTIVSNVSYYGGFDSTLTGTNGIIGIDDTGITVIDRGYANDYANNVSHSGCTFSKFKFTKTQKGYTADPGGSYVNNVTVDYDYCIWKDCEADGYNGAGGLLITGSSAVCTLTECEIDDCKLKDTSYEGSAVHSINSAKFYMIGGSCHDCIDTLGDGLFTNEGSDFELTGVDIYDNYVEKGTVNVKNPITVDSCNIYSNTVDVNGPAILCSDTAAVVYSNLFGNQGDSGCIYVANSNTLIISDSDLNNNTASLNGGAITLKYNTVLPTIQAERVKIEYNVAADNGGGISMPRISGTSYLKSVLVSNNQADNYGGIDQVSSASSDTIDYDNCTIVDNEALVGNVGGIGLGDFADFDNNISWGNTGAVSNIQVYITNGNNQITYSCIENKDSGGVNDTGALGSNNTDGDPLFDNGVYSPSDPYQLSVNSSCIGTASIIYQPINDVLKRPWQSIDIGAYSSGYLFPTKPSTIKLLYEDCGRLTTVYKT